MDPIVDGQSDEHRYEGNSKNIEMTNDQGGESHRVSQSDDQACNGFKWTTGPTIADDKNQRAEGERDDGCLG